MESIMAAAAAPADSRTTTAAATPAAAGPPLPRAIQLMMAISISSTTTTASTKTIGDGEHFGAARVFLWVMLVSLPSTLLASAAALTYAILRDDGAGELISLAGLGVLAVPVLLCVYLAVVLAAWCHLGLFAPRMPYAAFEALFKVGFEWMMILLSLISLGPLLLPLGIYQAWLLLAAWDYLLGLLVASAVAFWLCVLRTYGGGGGGERQYLLLRTYGGERGGNSSCSCGEAVIDGLAYPYARLLYEVAVRVPYGERRFRTDAVQADVAAV